MLKKFTNKKESGFTLAELLIVVAIIAVLVAIAIPIFSAQLEKSRDATTVANIRSAYAEASSTYLAGVAPSGGDITYDKTNKAVTVDNIKWESSDGDISSASEDLPDALKSITGTAPSKKGKAKITFTFEENGNVTAEYVSGS